MPPRIHALPPLVVNQIAAGEVIERPASVVKELLENAVDAGSSRIEVAVENGGHDLVQVVDDGHGIAAEDLPLAFASHATSKLRDADDLFSIGTFGFRGEALASIGGVAKVTLQSRPQDATIGAEVECEGSVLSPIRPWNGAPGTRIEVRQLFFNTPVRRKFLRAPATEMGHITESVTRLALAHPRIDPKDGLHLVLRHSGRLVYEVSRTTDLKERIEVFYGPDVAGSLLAVEASAGPVRLHGFVAEPTCDRNNARMQNLFVNGRWVRDRSLGHAIQEAYRGLLMTGRYAVAFLFLDLPADHVDVNVHPTKGEVRFRHAQSLHHLIFTTVKARLRQANLVPQLQAMPVAEVPRAPEFRVVPRERVEPPIGARSASKGVEESAKRQAGDAPTYWEARVTPRAPLPLFDAPAPRALQIYDVYLVVETDEGMLVIDQHALHERILFDQFTRRIREGALQTQALLIPEPIDLPPESAARALEHRDSLAELGLGVEDFGGATILLTRYPALLGRRSPRETLLAVVEHLASQERVPTREVLFNDLLSLMACHAAVRAGERLSQEQISDLLAQRHLADDHHHCPHGRPTSLLFTRQDLERQFRRA